MRHFRFANTALSPFLAQYAFADLRLVKICSRRGGRHSSVAGLFVGQVVHRARLNTARPRYRDGGNCGHLYAARLELWRGRGDEVWRWPIMLLLLGHPAAIPARILLVASATYCNPFRDAGAGGGAGLSDWCRVCESTQCAD